MKHKKRNQLFYLESNIPQIIQDLASKLIIPEFKKKITNHLNNSKIPITSNKIENRFLKKNFPKHIKKLFKSKKKGILKKFDLKLMY